MSAPPTPHGAGSLDSEASRETIPSPLTSNIKLRGSVSSRMDSGDGGGFSFAGMNDSSSSFLRGGGRSSKMFDDDPLARMAAESQATGRSSSQLLEGLARATMAEDERRGVTRAYQKYDWNTSGLFNVNFSALEGILSDVAQALQNHEIQITRLSNHGAGHAKVEALEDRVDSLAKAIKTMENRQVQLVERLDRFMTKHRVQASMDESSNSSSRAMAAEPLEVAADASSADLLKTLKQSMGIDSSHDSPAGGSSPSQMRSKTEGHLLLDQTDRGGRRDSNTTRWVDERTFMQFSGETHAHIADLTLAIARLHKAVNAAPTKKELHEISEQMRLDFESMRKVIDHKFVELTARADEMLSEDLRKLHTWMADQDKVIRERYASLLLKLDLCVKKESFAALGDECKLMQEQVADLKLGLARNATYMTLIEQKLGIRTWKTIIKEKLSLVQRSYFQRWWRRVERQREFERVATQLMTHIFRTMMFRLTGSAFQQWKEGITLEKEQELRVARARSTMSRCLNAIGRGGYFKAFNQWKQVLVAEKQRHKRDDLMELVADVGNSDPVFVARMLVNEIQMIKSIDFAKQEENRKQGNKTLQQEFTAILQKEVATLKEDDQEIKETVQYKHQLVKEELEDHMKLLLGHQETMKDIEKVLRNELYSAADDIRRSIGDNLANYMEENDRKMLLVEASITDLRGKICMVDGLLNGMPQQLQDNVVHVEEKVDLLAAAMKTDLSNVATKHEQKVSELRSVMNVLQSDLVGLQREYVVLQRTQEALAVSRMGENGPDLSEVVKACGEFENTAKEYNYVPALFDESAVAAIGGYAQSCGEWIADKVDLEGLKRFAGATADDDLSDMEELLTAKRAALVDATLVHFDKAVKKQFATSTSVRLEARTKFRTKLRETLMQAMAGKDQVMVMANTRVSRVPACVACDRPLTAKQPRMTARELDESLHGSYSMSSSINNYTMGSSTSHHHHHHTHGRPQSPAQGSPKPRGAALLESDCDQGPSVRHGMVEGRSGSNATGPADRPRQYCPGGGNYVFRGGFKMPRVMHIPPQVLDRLSPKKQILEEGSIRLGMPFASSSSQTGNSSIGSPTAAGDTQVMVLSSTEIGGYEDSTLLPDEQVRISVWPEVRNSRPRTAPLPRIP